MQERLVDRWLPRLGPIIFLVLWSGGFAAVRIGLLDTGPLTSVRRPRRPGPRETIWL